MTLDKDNLLESIMSSLDRIQNIKSDELPNIDLYMDQVTSLMESKLRHASRNVDDKVLTKTMINNYTKNELLPPPEKKKYSKEHLVVLIFIFYSKGFLSITDIQSILGPLTERYFGSDGKLNMCAIYDEVFKMEDTRIEELKEDVTRKFLDSQKTFEGCSEEDKEILQRFAFIFMLGYDVYAKTLLIEKLLDTFNGES